MQRALQLAERAARHNEVPVGAVLVSGNRLLGEGHNRPVSDHDPTAHAEIIALRDAGRRAGNYRFPGTTLYVTLEPCPMCAGALVHARVSRVVAATRDPRGGAAGSVLDVFAPGLFNHDVQFECGLHQPEASELLRAFFRSRR